MRTVTGIKKCTALKDLHISLVPKCSTVSSEDISELDCDRDASNISEEIHDTVTTTSDVNPVKNHSDSESIQPVINENIDDVRNIRDNIKHKRTSLAGEVSVIGDFKHVNDNDSGAFAKMCSGKDMDDENESTVLKADFSEIHDSNNENNGGADFNLGDISNKDIVMKIKVEDNQNTLEVKPEKEIQENHITGISTSVETLPFLEKSSFSLQRGHPVSTKTFGKETALPSQSRSLERYNDRKREFEDELCVGIMCQFMYFKYS